MSGASFIIVINLAVAGLLAAAFLLISAYDRAYRSARWIAAAYGMGVVYCAFEMMIPASSGSRVIVTMSYASLLAGIVAYVVGISKKYSAAVPWLVVAALFAASVALNVFVQTMPRELILRNVLWQTPYAAMQAIAATIVLRARGKTALDKALCAVLLLSVAQFLAKPWIMAGVGGNGASASGYIQTTYALFSQTIGSLTSMLVALMTLAVYVRSMLADAAVRSETDELSGLLNRRGFEDRADALLIASQRKTVPVSLVICDLDHFKAVNDTYGHEAGDRVIVAFANVLQNAAGSHVVGRIGGEEFAVALAGVDLPSARLFAEGVRVAFSGTKIFGLPQTHVSTASFGVAEQGDGETYGDLIRRADVALYEAKKSGRDCVRISLSQPRTERRTIRALR